MRRHFFLVLSISLSLLFLGPTAQAQKGIQNAAKQRKAFEKALKVLADPTANYETKEAAADAVASLPYPLANEVSRAMFLQNNEAISSEGVNALFSSFTPASYRKDNLKFVCDNILRATPQAQSALLLALTPSIGIQTRENELLYYALAQKVVRDYTRNTTPLESKKNEALSRACLALSLSPHFGTEDRALLMKAARTSKFSPSIALALSYRDLLTPKNIVALGSDLDAPKENIFLQFGLAMRDKTVRDKIVRDVEAVTKKVYVDPPGGINLDPAEDVANINLLRFVHFPEKKQLVFAALKSKNDLIKQSGLLVAAEDYPDIILSTRDIKATFDHHSKDQEGYEALLTYFALRHPQYVKRVQAMIGSKAFNEATEKLRREGITVNYWAAYGFAGLY